VKFRPRSRSKERRFEQVPEDVNLSELLKAELLRFETVTRFIEKRRDELFAPNVQIEVRGKRMV
jgi:hypothetical protein